MNKTICLSVLLMSVFISTPSFADDNIAACEIVLMAPVISPEQQVDEEQMPTEQMPTEQMPTEQMDEKGGADEPKPMIATFLPADKFLFSVFDGEAGHIKDVDGKPIRALMCTRSNVLPTEFDAKLIHTEIPLHLSQNFDSADSALLSIQIHDGKYVHQYAGPDLSTDDKVSLKTYLRKLNAKRKMKTKTKEKPKQKSGDQE